MRPPERPYLTEVQGLRTVAALLVAVGHIWTGRISGGVDVFFVVFAYFMTLSLLDVGAATGIRDTAARSGDYLLRTARRLLPAMTVVVVVTIAVFVAIGPREEWDSGWRQAFASLGFFENRLLADEAGAYLIDGTFVTPFQQFWALSLQGQVALAGAILVPICWLIAKAAARGPWTSRGVLGVLLGVITIGSLAAALAGWPRGGDAAYFELIPRAWEFSVGGLLALAASRPVPRIPRPVALTAGWVALAVLVAFPFVVDPARLYPVPGAFVPVAAAAVILWTSRASAAPAVLRWKPLVWAAPFSFAFYLWHWPILVFLRYTTDTPRFVSLRSGLVIIALAALLAWATTTLVERPLRSWTALRSRRVVAVATCVVLLLVPATVSTAWAIGTTADRAAAVADLARFASGEPPEGAFVPDPIIARDDWPSQDCDATYRGETLILCDDGTPNPEKTIALVGNSHAAMWAPALERIADRPDIRLVKLLRYGCVIGEITDDTGCDAWQSEALEDVIELHPDLVVMIGTRGIGTPDIVPDGFRAFFDRLGDVGIPVLAIRDNPAWPTSPVTCIERHPTAPEECAVPRANFYSPDFDFDLARSPNVRFADFADLYCGTKFCYANDGPILRYVDSHHLSTTWILSVTPRLEEEVLAALGDESLRQVRATATS